VSIRGYTEMIVKGRLGPINDEQKQGLTLSLRNIDRLIGMIDNLLSFARMDRESAAMNLSTFPLEAIVAEVVQLLRDRLAERKIELSLRSEQRGLVLHADRDKVYQVFLNVIQNAIKFNREGGSIEIVARRGKPGFALVHVRDTGEGIPKEDLERIFDRFYQAKTSAERASDGTGIGLAIVRNILRLHGCVINASSTVGEGTTISFTLPVAEARGEEAATETERPGGGAPPRTDPGQARPEGGPEPAASPGETPSAAQQAEERRRLRIIRRG
jgi:signal transduction histidine kinase